MELQRDAEIVIIRLAAGRANAMGPAWLQRLDRLVAEVEAQAASQSTPARAAIIVGYERYFSAGFDLPALVQLDRPQMAQFLRQFEQAMLRVRCLPLPVVAAINGHAVAGGCVLALQADYRIMAEAPVRIGLSEVQLGVGLPPFIVEGLRAQVPPSAHGPLALCGLLCEPRRAVELGLVHETTPPAELEQRALELARALADLPRPGLLQVKRALLAPMLERVEQLRDEGERSWLDTWFSDAAQQRLTESARRLTGPRS